tara:strand:+ start:3851 stop:4474 length:624 start_codon:yes stop_codon:yes gene_type:complete
MNNIKLIRDFIENKDRHKLLINKVNEEIGHFYVNLIEAEANSKKVKLYYKNNLAEERIDDLFEVHKLDICFSDNKKIVGRFIESDSKCIIFTDYKNYKNYSKNVFAVNGYAYQEDVEFYINEILEINNLEFMDYCKGSPHLAFSEISKYIVNSSNYIKENKIKEKSNFILDIRKRIFDLKRKQKDSREIYNYLKQEVKYKKFNFLAY